MANEPKPEPPDAAEPLEGSAAELSGQQGEASREELDARFWDLYARYYESIVTFLVRLRLGLTREDARDLAQEAFLRVYRSMGSYRGEAERGFLETTARNVALNHVRRQNAKIRGEGKVIAWSDTVAGSAARDLWSGRSPASAEDDALKRETVARLHAEVSRLPRVNRACLLLRLDGLTYRQIGRALRLSEDAVKARLYDTRQRLKKRLGEDPVWID